MATKSLEQDSLKFRASLITKEEAVEAFIKTMDLILPTRHELRGRSNEVIKIFKGALK